MGEQHALGPAGGAGGVDLHGDVVVGDGGRVRQRLGGAQVVPLGRADHDVGHLGRHQRGVLAVGDDELHVGVVEDVGLRLGGQLGVERHEYQARARRAEHHVVVLAAVGRQQADAGASGKPPGSEAGTEPQRTVSQLPGSDTLGRRRRTVDEDYGVAAGCAVEQFGDVHRAPAGYDDARRRVARSTSTRVSWKAGEPTAGSGSPRLGFVSALTVRASVGRTGPPAEGDGYQAGLQPFGDGGLQREFAAVVEDADFVAVGDAACPRRRRC